MKKNIILTVMLAVCLCHLKAQPEESISPTLASKFADEFPYATNLRWTQGPGVTMASFLSEGECLIAYYDAGEQRVAIGRKVAEAIQLPILVRDALSESCKKLGEGIRMGPIFELAMDNSTLYVVSVEGDDKVCTFKFDTMGNRTLVSKRPAGRGNLATPTPYIAREPRF